jgi:hypothetical protein
MPQADVRSGAGTAVLQQEADVRGERAKEGKENSD